MNFKLSRSIRSSICSFSYDEIKYKKLQFDEFVDLWVPRNAKALKSPILAGEGIEILYILKEELAFWCVLEAF